MYAVVSYRVRLFSPWELPASEETTTDDTQEYVYEPPQITELLAVNAQTLPLFSRLGLRLVQLSILSGFPWVCHWPNFVEVQLGQGARWPSLWYMENLSYWYTTDIAYCQYLKLWMWMLRFGPKRSMTIFSRSSDVQGTVIVYCTVTLHTENLARTFSYLVKFLH